MKDKSWVESEREELSGDDLDGGQLVRSLRQERREEMRTLMGKSEAVRMAECLGEELGSELNRGMWLGSEGRNERDRRRRDRRERRGEWERSAAESGDGRYESLEDRIRGLTERIEGLERRTWKMEEKRRNAGSSSDGEE